MAPTIFHDIDGNFRVVEFNLLLSIFAVVLTRSAKLSKMCFDVYTMAAISALCLCVYFCAFLPPQYSWANLTTPWGLCLVLLVCALVVAIYYFGPENVADALPEEVEPDMEGLAEVAPFYEQSTQDDSAQSIGFQSKTLLVCLAIYLVTSSLRLDEHPTLLVFPWRTLRILHILVTVVVVLLSIMPLRLHEMTSVLVHLVGLLNSTVVLVSVLNDPITVYTPYIQLLLAAFLLLHFWELFRRGIKSVVAFVLIISAFVTGCVFGLMLWATLISDVLGRTRVVPATLLKWADIIKKYIKRLKMFTNKRHRRLVARFAFVSLVAFIICWCLVGSFLLELTIHLSWSLLILVIQGHLLRSAARVSTTVALVQCHTMRADSLLLPYAGWLNISAFITNRTGCVTAIVFSIVLMRCAYLTKQGRILAKGIDTTIRQGLLVAAGGVKKIVKVVTGNSTLAVITILMAWYVVQTRAAYAQVPAPGFSVCTQVFDYFSPHHSDYHYYDPDSFLALCRRLEYQPIPIFKNHGLLVLAPDVDFFTTKFANLVAFAIERESSAHPNLYDFDDLKAGREFRVMIPQPEGQWMRTSSGHVMIVEKDKDVINPATGQRTLKTPVYAQGMLDRSRAFYPIIKTDIHAKRSYHNYANGVYRVSTKFANWDVTITHTETATEMSLKSVEIKDHDYKFYIRPDFYLDNPIFELGVEWSFYRPAIFLFQGGALRMFSTGGHYFALLCLSMMPILPNEVNFALGLVGFAMHEIIKTCEGVVIIQPSYCMIPFETTTRYVAEFGSGLSGILVPKSLVNDSLHYASSTVRGGDCSVMGVANLVSKIRSSIATASKDQPELADVAFVLGKSLCKNALATQSDTTREVSTFVETVLGVAMAP